jgi:DNA polymerase
MAPTPATRLWTGSAADFIPPKPTLLKLREAAAGCRGCDLWVNATQTVFGEGPRSADVILVGEQPGDQEDRAGHPFVGPAGKLLDTSLQQAGIDRARVYVTNSVKHFKFVQIERGRRLHKKPTAAEIRACTPWLQEEVRLVKPRAIVALGATAAPALLGKQLRVTRDRGKPIPSEWAEAVVATVHPSAVLRAPDDARDEMRS